MRSRPPMLGPVEQLAHADHALRQVLVSLDHSASSQSAPADVQALTTAVQHYQHAVLACLGATSVNVLQLTPDQLLAYRQADPIYRLGYVRGYRRGQAQYATAPVLTAYAHHATLPAPTAAPPADYAALVQQVRRFLVTLQQRYGAGPTTHRSSFPTAHAAH
jgi:hypothetical protein